MVNQNNEKIIIRGGNAGCIISGRLVSDNGQSCPRKCYLRSYRVEPPVGEVEDYVFASGKVYEEVFAKHNPGFKMNVRMEDIPEIDGIPIMVEVDAISPEGVLYELKSIQSSDKLKPYLITGEYKFDNFVQLAFSMAVRLQNKGVLRYISVIFHEFTVNKVNYKIKPSHHRDYKVIYNESGRFLVDNEPTILTTDNIYTYIDYMVWVYNNDKHIYVKDLIKPYDSINFNKNTACFYCYFKTLCQWADENNIKLPEFRREAAIFQKG